MSRRITIECEIHTTRRARGQKELRRGPSEFREFPKSRVPRVSRLMALAIHLDGLVRTGQLRDYAEIARLGHVSRARVTQIMNLLMLAPDIQEQLLFLPDLQRGREPFCLRQLQHICGRVDWRQQRQWWQDLRERVLGQ